MKYIATWQENSKSRNINLYIIWPSNGKLCLHSKDQENYLEEFCRTKYMHYSIALQTLTIIQHGGIKMTSRPQRKVMYWILWIHEANWISSWQGVYWILRSFRVESFMVSWVYRTRGLFYSELVKWPFGSNRMTSWLMCGLCL